MEDEEYIEKIKQDSSILNKLNAVDLVSLTIVEKPKRKDKKSLVTRRDINSDINNYENNLSNYTGKGFGKNKITAKKFKNMIFLADDGNYYQSKQDSKGIYHWVLLKKSI